MNAPHPDPNAVLAIEALAEADRVAAWMRESLATRLKRRGFVVAVSGGIDSSLCAALAVRAVGADRVHALLLPERESSASSTQRGLALVKHLGIAHACTDITAALEGVGCYRQRDEALASVVQGYGAGWKSKIAIAGGLDAGINYFKVVAQSPDGQVHEARLPLKAYLQVVAATNFKQRVRKAMDYFHADRLNHAVIGTPNRLEYDQGFFVKVGDGAADIKPIAHLYKTQVYAMARALGLPEEITQASPTTDTYTLAQGQDEFYFALPYAKMDIALWAVNHGLSASQAARLLALDEGSTQRVFDDIESKRRVARALHAHALTIEPVMVESQRP